jgi:hypothetical protein
MPPQVGHQLVSLVSGELEFVDPDELGPAEAVSAESVTGLARRGEEQHRLAVLVLHPLQALVTEHGNVELQLTRRVRVELVLDLPRRHFELGGGHAAADEIVHAPVCIVAEHLGLWEGQLEDRVVRDVGPVDQVVDDVVVHTKGKHGRDRLHAGAKRLGKLPQLRN